MADDLIFCMAGCKSNSTGSVVVGNDSFDLDCITGCSQNQGTIQERTTEKYTHIIQIIAVVLLTFGLFGKVFNCIIFLRKPLRGTSTGLLLFLKTIFDLVPLLWTFILDTRFFVPEEQFNASRLLCTLSRSSDIFVSWSIGFVILACTIRLASIIHTKYLPQPTRLHVFILILLMMCCGLVYNWHVFYYPSLDKIVIVDAENRTIVYCNILFGRQMGYFAFEGFQPTKELPYNASVVNFIVNSLIPFTIVASTNIVIIVRVIKTPSLKRLAKINSYYNVKSKVIHHQTNSLKHQTKKDVSYETTITLTTSCVFLITNITANIYVYVKSSYRAQRAAVTEGIKMSNVYLILRMLTLIDTVFEFYIYFLTGKKFRQEVIHVIKEILQYTPLKHYFKLTHSGTNDNNNNHHRHEQKNLNERQLSNSNKKNQLNYLSLTQSTTTTMSRGSSYMESPHRQKLMNFQWSDTEERLDRIESTV